jgi:hypothetical protein
MDHGNTIRLADDIIDNIAGTLATFHSLGAMDTARQQTADTLADTIRLLEMAEKSFSDITKVKGSSAVKIYQGMEDIARKAIEEISTSKYRR